MPRKPRDIESRLVNKFHFKEARSHSPDHRWYELRIAGLPVIMTKISHSKGEIGPRLEAMIARQLRVKKAFFQEMIDCTKGPDAYEAQVRDNPVPPWDVRY